MDNEEIMEISPSAVKAEAAEVHEEPTEVASENTPEDAAVKLKAKDAEVTEETAEIPRDNTPEDEAVELHVLLSLAPASKGGWGRGHCHTCLSHDFLSLDRIE